MVCDLCSKKEATVHLTEVINHQSRELHLCEKCAQEKGAEAAEQLTIQGADGSELLFGGSLAGLLAGLTDLGAKKGAPSADKTPCPQCGMTYADFRKTGRLGCGRCYQTFRALLAPLLKRIHGSSHYVGRAPFRSVEKRIDAKEETERLKERLKASIASEAFEEAAQLRDKIRALEARTQKTKPAARRSPRPRGPAA